MRLKKITSLSFDCQIKINYKWFGGEIKSSTYLYYLFIEMKPNDTVTSDLNKKCLMIKRQEKYPHFFQT